MTPPTHTYAIFDPRGDMCIVGQPGDTKDACIQGMFHGKPLPYEEYWPDYVARGWTLKAVTVCDRERLKALMTALLKSLDYIAHTAWCECSHCKPCNCHHAEIFKAFETITERSEGEHETNG